MVEAYHYVRFRWWDPADLEDITRSFGEKFVVEVIDMPEDEGELALHKKGRERLTIRADTLCARLSPYRASLYQRVPSPFTDRDLELRARILELYAHDKSTPFLLKAHKEPKFEQASDNPPRGSTS